MSDLIELLSFSIPAASVSSKPSNLTIPIAVAVAVPVIIIVIVLVTIVVTIVIKRKKRKSQKPFSEKAYVVQTVEYSGPPVNEGTGDEVTVLQNNVNNAARAVQNPPFKPAEQAEVILPPPNNRTSRIEPDSAIVNDFDHWDGVDDQMVIDV